MVFLSYVAFGALLSSLMMSLTFLNGLFFTIVTTLTIGFGDIVPVTPAQRFAVCLYAVFGIIILGAGVRLTTEAVLEGIEVGYRRRLQGYKKRRNERKRERAQVRRWREAVEERLVERGLEVWTPDIPGTALTPSTLYERPKVHHQESSFMIRGRSYKPHYPMRLNTEGLSAEALESAAKEAGVPLEEFIGRKFRRRARHRRHHHHHHHHHHHNPDQSDQPQPQQGEQSARVPLEFSWTLDDAAANEHESQKTRWCSGTLWKKACRILLLKKSGDPGTDAESEPSSNMTASSMLKVVEKEEWRSLCVKVRFSFLGNNAKTNVFCF
jgi:potassium channel subfamily K